MFFLREFIGNHILFAFFFLMMIFFVITDTIFQKKKVEQINKQDDTKKNITIKEIILIILMLVIAIIAILGILILLKIGNEIILYFFLVFALLGWVVILPFSIRDFIQFLFVKKKEYKLTKEVRNSLILIGAVSAIICLCYTNGDYDKIHAIYGSMCSFIGEFGTDLLKITAFTFWYFITIFYSCFFFVLSVENIVFVRNINDNQNKNEEKKNKKKEQKKESNRNVLPLSTEVELKINNLSKNKRLKKCMLWLWWFLLAIVDIVFMYIKLIYEFIKSIFLIIVLSIPRFIESVKKWVFEKLINEQGKTIIVMSRFSLVFSLMIVYFINKYNSIFSNKGSEIYEFLCSVIIIPTLITQIIDLRSDKNNNSKNDINI